MTNNNRGSYIDPSTGLEEVDLDAHLKNEEDAETVADVLKQLVDDGFSGDFIVNFRQGQAIHYKINEFHRVRRNQNE